MRRIGLTFDLKEEYLNEGYTAEEAAEFDRGETIDAIEMALKELGYHPERIGHIRQLVGKLAAGERWDMVFNISEGMYGTGREAAVPVLLDAYRIPYTFSDPLVLALTLHKGMTKRVIRDAGLNTPPFITVQYPGEAVPENLTFPLFVKPVAEGTGKGISQRSRVENAGELQKICTELLPRYPEGLLVEEFLPGREFTVGITGTGTRSRCVGVMEIHYTNVASGSIYSLETKAHYEHLVSYSTPEEEIVLPAANWPSMPGTSWVVATEAGSTCGSIASEIPLSSKSIHWRVSIRFTPTCPCWPTGTDTHTCV